jgi:hypothetical protein
MMDRQGYHLWTFETGIHELIINGYQNVNVQNISEEKIFYWKEIILNYKLKNDNHDLKNIIDLYNEKHSNLNEKTPLTLFVSNSQLFYELFWPFAREKLGREYYILKFDTPLMVQMNLVYELFLTSKDNGKISMIYLGCLSDTVPILTATVNDVRESIVPCEILIPIVKSMLEKFSDWLLIKTQLELNDDELENLTREILIKSKPEFIEIDALWSNGKF